VEDRELYQAILGLGEPWTVERVELKEAEQAVEVWVGEREGTSFTCPECGEPSPIYDRAERRWRHLDTCQFTTILRARVPRVGCRAHGVKTVRVPWAEPGSRFTLLVERLAIAWLREATPSAVARRLGLSWDEAEGIMQRAVRRGLIRRSAESAATPVTRIGIDEKSFLKHHQSVSVAVDLDRARVLPVADDRKAESLAPYFEGLSEAERAGITAIAMDMWEPYRKTVRAHVPDADAKIVFDKFHVIAHVTSAVDQVRKQEHKARAAAGDTRLKGTKYTWLKTPKHFSRKAWKEFTALRESTLKSARAWAMKESLSRLMELHVCRRGSNVLQVVVRLGHAVAVGADAEGGSDDQIAFGEHPHLPHASGDECGDRGAEREDPVGEVLGAWLPEPRGVQDSDPLPRRWAGPRAAARLSSTHTKPGRALLCY